MSIENINKSLDIALKLSAPIGVAIMLFLQSQFVTRSEFAKAYERADVRLTKIEELLIRMERNDKILADHEDRIRLVERNQNK